MTVKPAARRPRAILIRRRAGGSGIAWAEAPPVSVVSVVAAFSGVVVGWLCETSELWDRRENDSDVVGNERSAASTRIE